MTLPEAYLTGYLHDGPHDGQTLQMPWARSRIVMIRWEGEEPVEDVYVLAGPWRGQATAHYTFAVVDQQAEAA
jgi:hypothetical protein